MWTLRKVLFPQDQLRELSELNYNISAKTPSSFVLNRFKCKSHFPQPKYDVLSYKFLWVFPFVLYYKHIYIPQIKLYLKKNVLC